MAHRAEAPFYRLGVSSRTDHRLNVDTGFPQFPNVMPLLVLRYRRLMFLHRLERPRPFGKFDASDSCACKAILRSR
jgi:hypothetical protein